ncbi:unnamed protein product [Hapterophycus canaliculatus]
MKCTVYSGIRRRSSIGHGERIGGCNPETWKRLSGESCYTRRRSKGPAHTTIFGTPNSRGRPSSFSFRFAGTLCGVCFDRERGNLHISTGGNLGGRMGSKERDEVSRCCCVDREDTFPVLSVKGASLPCAW